VAALLTIVEIGTRLLIPRISRVEARTSAEYDSAVSPAPAGRAVVLFVGNSLLLEGVQFDRVRQSFAPQIIARRLVVESTGYHDWHYGLRRLFADDARPEAVVVMLDPTQWAADASRGEYTAYRLTLHRDILRFCGDLKLHPTNASNMIVANISMFYGLRSEIRKQVLRAVMPDVPVLTARLAQRSFTPPALPPDQLGSLLRYRISVLRDECARNGSRLIVALPPWSNFYDSLVFVKSAATAVGVATLLPFSSSDYVLSDFAPDQYHLNGQGATKFTSELIDGVREQLRATR
jgi:hypothetical protein